MRKNNLSNKIVVIIVFIILIILDITAAVLQHYYSKDIKWIECFYYSTQIFTSLFVTASVIIAAYQYYLTAQSTKTNLSVIQVQRAIDLSAYYKDNILNRMRAVKYIFRNTGIDEIICKVHGKNIEHFDMDELTTIFSDEDIETLKKITQSEKFANVILQANNIYNLDNNILQNSQKEENFSEQINAFGAAFFSTTLNDIEYFAMHFSHKTADDSVVYQSLHQTYLELVEILYYHIAKPNQLAPGKYYTNLISLYKKWKSESESDKSNFLEGVRELQKTGTIINDK